ncbi:MAG: nucleotidyltransferase family protein [Clostridium sp.]
MSRYIEKLSINYKESIYEALKSIDEAAKGIVYVVDNNGKLVGTITDGDIRRALIKGKTLDADVQSIMNNNPVSALSNSSYEERKQIMIQKAIRELPIVDENNILINTVSLSELILPRGKENLVIIMAGGLGTRLKELTKEIPKPMLNLGNKPIMEHIIENFKMYGFNKFLISVNYKYEIIENYFESGYSHGCRINYLKEDKRLGTAGAISLAKDYIKDDFFVVNGDVYSTANFSKIFDYHKKNDNDITVVSVKKTMNIAYGVIESNADDSIKEIKEKPSYDFIISGGMYCLSPKVLKYIPKDEYFEITELIDICIKNNMNVRHYLIEDYWMDIGRIEDYNQVNSDIYKLACKNEVKG